MISLCPMIWLNFLLFLGVFFLIYLFVKILKHGGKLGKDITSLQNLIKKTKLEDIRCLGCNMILKGLFCHRCGLNSKPLQNYCFVQKIWKIQSKSGLMFNEVEFCEREKGHSGPHSDSKNRTWPQDFCSKDRGCQKGEGHSGECDFGPPDDYYEMSEADRDYHYNGRA